MDVHTPRRALTFSIEQPSPFTHLFLIPEVSFHAEQHHPLLMDLVESESVAAAHHRGRRHTFERIHSHAASRPIVLRGRVRRGVYMTRGRGPTCMSTRPQVGIGSRQRAIAGLRRAVGVGSSELLRPVLSHLPPCRGEGSLRVLSQVSGLGNCAEIVSLIP